jgi:hypothetical protein
MLLQAISARNKSLKILQELIEKEPSELALINGLYNMSLLKVQIDGWTPPALEWNSRALEAAEKFLGPSGIFVG